MTHDLKALAERLKQCKRLGDNWPLDSELIDAILWAAQEMEFRAALIHELLPYQERAVKAEQELATVKQKLATAQQEIERKDRALAELVRLKDMKDASEITISEQDRGALLYLYEQAKPKAWAAARAALAKDSPLKEPA